MCLASATVASQEPEFSFSLSPCPATVSGPVGSLYDASLEVVLTTRDNPSATDGALGWSVGVTVEASAADAAVRVADVTTRGTAAASVDDEPPGLREASGFERTELASDGIGECEGKSAALTAVVLSFTQPVTLPPDGPETVARVRVESVFPAPGEITELRLAFADGCIGGGGPVSNDVVWMGATVLPARETCTIELTGAPRHFRRGDANDDDAVDISDVSFTLNCKFRGGICPACRDAADANDDGAHDISDAVYTLEFLFRDGRLPPAPGPYEPGPDPTEDALPDCGHASFDDFVPLGVSEHGRFEYLHAPTGIVLVRLPAGAFTMGSPPSECGREEDEGPEHRVEISGFLISKYEVTQAQWESVMGSNPSTNVAGMALVPPGTDTSDWPVESVTWGDALLFASRLGLSLPTEAQWEYACRADTRTAFAFGDVLAPDAAQFSPQESPCEARAPFRTSTTAVGSFPPNAFGIHDMHGNVREWCLDRYHADFYATPEATAPDPVDLGTSDDRAVRGGGWSETGVDARSAARAAMSFRRDDPKTGVRVVWRLPPS